MVVIIDSGPIEATDKLREVPRDKWLDLMRIRRDYMHIHLAYDCRCLLEFVEDAKLMFEELGFASAEAMIRDGYRLVPEEIDLALEWLRLNPPDEPLPLDAAIKLGKQGGDRRSEKARADQVGNTNLVSAGGSTRTYILARLGRDGHIKLATRVCTGEMSANAAAIEAGFRKKLSAFDRILKLLPSLNIDECKQLQIKLSEWGI